MSSALIQCEEKYSGQVLEVQLNTPPANILTAKMMAEIEAVLNAEERAPHRKLLVFSGAGAHFSFGASVEEHTADKVRGMLPVFHQMIQKIIDCRTPTLAKVSGLCLGGGFELALACTFFFADENAKLAVPEIELGVFPPVAAALLPLQCGSALANRLILTGEKMTAKTLREAGLLTDTAPTGELDAQVSAFIEKQILPKSASSLALAHRAARRFHSDHFQHWISEAETIYLNNLMATHDANEGIRSFLEKRPPKWSDT